MTLRKLIDMVQHQLDALEKLRLPVNQWDTLLIQIILKNFDARLKGEWEDKISDTLENNQLPTVKEFMTFLNKKCAKLEAIHSDEVDKSHDKYHREGNISRQGQSNQTKRVQVYSVLEKGSCFYCKESHFINNCPEFLKLSIQDKHAEIKKLKLCSNYLRPGHFKSQCKSRHCKKCPNMHNTLLHTDYLNSNRINKRV